MFALASQQGRVLIYDLMVRVCIHSLYITKYENLELQLTGFSFINVSEGNGQKL